MKRLVTVCLCFCIFLSLCAPSIAAQTVSADTSVHIWDEFGFVEETDTTKYYHKYVTLRLGETYSGNLNIYAAGLESKSALINDARIVEFLSNEDGKFTIKALNVGTTTIRLHYTRKEGFYNETVHWGAYKAEVLHVSVIPMDHPMEPTSANVCEWTR